MSTASAPARSASPSATWPIRVLLSLSGSGQVQPLYWLNPKIGIQYLVNVRAHRARLDSLSALEERADQRAQPARRGRWPVALEPRHARSAAQGPTVVSHYNVLPVIDVFGGVSGRDLGGVLRDIEPLDRRGRRRSCRAAASSSCAGRRRRCAARFIGPGRRPGRRHRPDLPAAGRQFPELARSFHHHHRAAGRAGRRGLGALPHADHAQRAGADGRDHEPRRGHRELRARRLLCPRQSARGHGAARPPRSTPAPPACAPSS